MRMAQIYDGLTSAHEETDESGIHHVSGNGDSLILADGTTIGYDGLENNTGNACFNYADWSALNDTGFWQDKTVNAKTLKIEEAGYGFRINGYFVPCYSKQNGYYTNDINIFVCKPGSRIDECVIKGLYCEDA